MAAPAALITGMCLFGIGFGISQNATFALMIDRAPVSGYGTASALWNLAYDAGYGAGPAVFGVFVVYTGYPAAFALTGMLMVAALVPALRDRAAQAAAAGRDGALRPRRPGAVRFPGMSRRASRLRPTAERASRARQTKGRPSWTGSWKLWWFRSPT